ncbi:hypothetical protein BISU_0478 [Bifidobacterium subtile]|uniref:Uncharacterized protein n=1 Tax=Bifidobacterium subtile TaxID=77635 RepID=A0A087E8A1_9BIFI|nr:hypothetical protein BISU_0478 [Bifidobacterium subtile]
MPATFFACRTISIHAPVRERLADKFVSVGENRFQSTLP